MSLVAGWLPPSRANYNTICYAFAAISPFAVVQFLTPWYPMGKTSIISRFNIPGRIGWFTMEIPGFLSLLYTSHTLSKTFLLNPTGILALPLPNQLMIAMFTTHYLHRAILAPLVLNPSMSPIHPFVWILAIIFQLCNGVTIGAWIGGYGKVHAVEWQGQWPRLLLGGSIWLAGLLANMWHDEELRRIRRDEIARRKAKEGANADIGKVYVMPERGLFKYVLHAHYFTEWIEWAGFWVFAGTGCLPAQTFFLNEVITMLPRAWNGWYWYVERFGRDKVGSKKAAIPFLF